MENIQNLVTTNRGDIPLSNLQIGDEVLGYDLEKKANITSKIIEVTSFEPKDNEYWIVVNNKYRFAPHQSIYINGKLCHAKDIEVGSLLWNGEELLVESVEKVVNKLENKVRILLDGNSRTYFIDGVLVHNASRFWVGGTGNWDAATTTNWSATSGGGGGSSVPTSSDTVTFDTLSNAIAYTVTITATANCSDLTIGAPLVGAVTWAGSSALNIYGNFSIAASQTRTYTGAITFAATSGTKTITSNSITYDSTFTFNGVGGTFQLVDNLSTLKGLTLTNGTFDATTNSTTVSITGSGQLSVNGAFTFYNFTRTSVGTFTYDEMTFFSNVTVTNTLTITGFDDTTHRMVIKSSVKGTAKTLTAATVAITNCNLRDITGAGAGNWNLSAVTGLSGDCGGNSGITFTTQSTQHWTNVNGGTWSTAANWTSRVPLPQDTAVMDCAFGTSKTVTSDVVRMGTIDWTGATWTTALSWNSDNSGNISPEFYGSFTLINSLTISGSTNGYSMFGRGSFTINGKNLTIDHGFIIDCVTGTYTLNGPLTLTTTQAVTITTGTFDINGNALSVGLFNGSGSSTRALKDTAASGSITLTGNANTIWSFSTLTSMTFTTLPTVVANYAGATGTRTISHGDSGTGTEINALNLNVTAGTDIITLTTAFKNVDLTGFSGTLTSSARTMYGNFTMPTGTSSGSSVMTFSQSSGTKTINIGISFDCPITLSCVGAITQLAANLTLGVTRTLTVSSGTLDANNYVISSGLINCGAYFLMGTATHLLTGTGQVWTGTNSVLTPSTSTLKITDTSNTAITFSGGGISYHNVWFARGASTASNTIAGSNFYNDFKDNGTAAHSILWTAGTTQTFKTFTVSGTAGQLITLDSTTTATYTFNKLGGGTVSCDYLVIQHCIAGPSGQWYGGANSTNSQATATAGSGWNFPRYWVGGTANWDAATTTNWSATSGGAGGATVPTISDDVYFDLHGNEASDAAYTVTITATANCCNLDISFTGTTKVTLAGSSALNIGGSLNMSGGTAQITRTYTGTISFTTAGTARTITMNGILLASPITFNGTIVNSVMGGWTLQDAFTYDDAQSQNLTHSGGALNTNGQTVKGGGFTTTSGTRSLTFGASTFNIGFWSAAVTSLESFSCGTSTINVLSNTTPTFAGGGLTYSTVTVTIAGGGAQITFTGANTFTTLTVTGGAALASQPLAFSADQTITGTLTLNGNSAINRLFILSTVIGSKRIFTAGTIVTKWTDYQDIQGAGAANWDLTAQVTDSSGDCGGNSGITFTVTTTQHWTNASSGSWSISTNWTSRVPLPQDNVVMDKAFGTSQTVTADMPRLGKSIDWTGATWTTALTFTPSVAQAMFGSLTLISGLTYTSSANILTLAGRGSFTITGNTVTVGQPVTINAPGGTYTMGAALTLGVTRTLTVTQGTFDTSSYVLSTGLLNLGTGANGISATLNLNAATHLLTGTGTVFSATSLLHTSVLNAGTSTLKINDTSNSSITCANAKILNNVWFSRGSSNGSLSITQSGIYNDFKDDGIIAHTFFFTGGTVQGFTTFTVSGISGQRISLFGDTLGNRYTLLQKTGTINSDYIVVRDSLVSGGATWNAGANSTFLTGNFFGSTFGWADAGATVKNRYWIAGGNGSYNDGDNWSTTSGGAANATAPIGEIVHLDANSGAGIVNIMAAATSGDFDCTGFTGTIAGTSGLTIYGLFKLVSGMAGFTYTGAPSFGSSGSSKTIDFSTLSYLGTNAITFTGVDSFSSNLFANNGYGDTWTLSSNLTCSQVTATLTLTSGTFDANGYNVTVGLFSSSNTNYRVVKLGTGTWLLTGTGTIWSAAISNQLTVTPSTSTIKANNPTSGTKTFAGGGKTYYNLYFTGFGTGAVQFSDSNTFNDLKIDSAPQTISFTPGTITSFSTFTCSGSVGNLMTIGALSSNSQYYLRPLAGHFSIDYVSISNCNVIGTGFVGTHSINTDAGILGNNSNVLFIAPTNVVAGQVTLSAAGVSGAVVRLIRQSDNMEVGSTTTNGSGNYSFYADVSKLYHVFIEYTTGGNKYNAKSLWNITPA